MAPVKSSRVKLDWQSETGTNGKVDKAGTLMLNLLKPQMPFPNLNRHSKPPTPILGPDDEIVPSLPTLPFVPLLPVSFLPKIIATAVTSCNLYYNTIS